MLTCAYTGHRPNKLPCGYDLNHPFAISLEQKIIEILTELKPDRALSGMAQGVDQIAARATLKLGIPLIAVIPFLGQEKIWPDDSQKEYQRILGLATEVITVSPGNYTAIKMQIRNQYLVDNSDKLIAIFDQSTGGTANCIQYALSKKKQIIRINPNDIKYGFNQV